MKLVRIAIFACVSGTFLSLCDFGAHAGERPIISRRDAIDPPTVARLLERGELALVESNADGTAKQVALFSAIAATPDQVWDRIYDVTAYPKFMRSVVKNEITKRSKDMQHYDWELDVPLFNLKGSRAMRGKRPQVIEVRGVSGNFRDGRERWELYPLDGGKRTLAVFYRTLDLRSAGLLMETVMNLEPSMEHGIGLAAGFAYVRDVRRVLEGLPEPKLERTAAALAPLVPINFEVRAVRSLLEFGQLALIESNPNGSLKQVALLALVRSSRPQLMEIVRAVESYPQFIPNLVKQKIVERTAGAQILEYEIEVPMVNVEGRSRMTVAEDGAIDLEAIGGDITRGHWRWEFLSLEPEVTVPIHYAYSDIKETSWFVERLLEKQPLFEHGIVVAAAVVAVRAMKARAEGGN